MQTHSSPSPWLLQLKQERPHFQLHAEESDFDVVIVGAGIAGVMTAFHTLQYTTHRVLLIDAGRIAHGATGRNAGQVVNYFERPFSEIVEAFGMEMAVRGQTEVESGWGIIEDILRRCQIDVHLYQCAGYAGFSTVEQLLPVLREQALRKVAGLSSEPVLMSADPTILSQVPKDLSHLLMPVPHSVVLHALKTEDPCFIAAEVNRKGCMNSARFSEELVAWMIATHGDRLRVAEHVPVTKIVLDRDGVRLLASERLLRAKKVVLCTNGFENFSIEHASGPEIDTAFHATVNGIIGYMAGYMDEPNQIPAAISYYRKNLESGPYNYLTRRPYEHPTVGAKSLICIGGPERILPDRATYDPHAPFPADIEETLDRELRTTYDDLPPSASKTFVWQGLMGYTPNKIRRVGSEPKNPNLLYNLGCNGVGILPSIVGGKRIGEILAGIQLQPSIFDPANGHR
jgi:glycine/D-amino acid oxidase-like deaminating enzyme